MFSKLTKPQITILIIFALFLVVEIILFSTGYLTFNIPEKRDNPPEDTTETSTTTVEKGIPEFSDKIDLDEEETKADKIIEVTTDSERDEQLGIYTVIVSSDGYSPNRIIVPAKTIISIKLRAEGGDYDLYIPSTGNYISVEDGEEKESSFRMSQPGTYRFECRDSCPLFGKIYGELSVKSEQ